ncbi:cell wall-binding protein YocH precursor [Clostridium puniceum]|uniref:Cell wall-binding protein YocH n=1 Tax=Clostridium puniceum TaxID=29367 RepID=A0A1S8TX09_9CLOT|nr:3D domain-containing protein [Clostridium puniceum]OOM82112.1 cell wall-binding protein YocH precursor [Clostridium puniceum]
MIEKLKQLVKESFSNGPTKAKIIKGIITIAVVIVTAVTIMSMKKTLIISIDGKEETFVTYKGTVKDVLQEKGITLASKDKVQPSLESKVSEKETIKLKTAIPVDIKANGIQVQVLTAEDTIKDMLDAEEEILQEQGIDFDKEIDEISPSLDATISSDTNIQLVKVQTTDLVEKQPINFDTIVEKNEELDSSVQKVKSEGVNGEKEITYQVVYKDGVEVSRNVKSTKTIVEPQNQVVVKGTGHIYASRGGGNITYKKKISSIATAYSNHSSTATGRRPVRNEGGLSTIAVDPSVIPLGSKVYVDGYGYAIASDTGGAIKGNKIDVYLNSSNECDRWGRKSVNVLVVAYPGEW